jgi:hypothetical protein
MIAPQPGTPGSIGQQHGLTRFTAALESIEAGQRQQESRDIAIQAQLATQVALLSQAVRWGRYQRWAIAGLGVLGLTLAGLVGWQVWHPPEQAYAKALGAVESVLEQQWGRLPKATQEALSATYGRVGLVSPGERQRK